MSATVLHLPVQHQVAAEMRHARRASMPPEADPREVGLKEWGKRPLHSSTPPQARSF